MTDISTNSFGASMDGLVRAGADIPDGNWQGTSDGLSGTWVVNVTYSSGMVYLDATMDVTGAVTGGVASPTQWYCVRMAVMRVLHDCYNDAANFNGITKNSYEATIVAGFSECVTLSIYFDSAKYNFGTRELDIKCF